MALKDVLQSPEIDIIDLYRIKTYYKKSENKYVEKFYVQKKINFFNIFSFWVFINAEYIYFLKYLILYSYHSENIAKSVIIEFIKEDLEKKKIKQEKKPKSKIILMNKKDFLS